MRTLPLALLLPLTAVLAQAPLPDAAPPEPRGHQKIERIRIEDAGARVDELRVGGQAQVITVQPRGGLPAYEMLPTDLARAREADRRGGAAGSPRVWNLLSF